MFLPVSRQQFLDRDSVDRHAAHLAAADRHAAQVGVLHRAALEVAFFEPQPVARPAPVRRVDLEAEGAWNGLVPVLPQPPG